MTQTEVTGSLSLDFQLHGGGAICCSRYLQERENVGFAQPPHAVAAAY